MMQVADGRAPSGATARSPKGNRTHLSFLSAVWCARTFSLMMAASLAVRMWVRGKAPLVVFRRGLGVRAGGLVVSLR
jgi:hypothetical protein